MKRHLLTGVVVAAGVAVLVAAGLNWERLRAWYVLETRFERISDRDAEVHEYRHKATGIVFEIRAPEK